MDSLKSRGSCSKLNFQNCRLIICFMGEKIRESWALSTTLASMCPKLSANRDSSNRNPIINSYASVNRLNFSQLYFTPFPFLSIQPDHQSDIHFLTSKNLICNQSDIHFLTSENLICLAEIVPFLKTTPYTIRVSDYSYEMMVLGSLFYRSG